MYILAQESFNINNIAFLALIGGVVAGWNQIKSLIGGFFNYFIRTDRVNITGSKSTKRFMDILLRNSVKIKWGNVDYHQTDECIYNYNNTREFFGSVYYIARKRWLLLYKRCIPIFISFEGEESLKITYIFKTFPLQRIMHEFANKTLEFENSRYTEPDKKFRTSGYSFEECIGSPSFQGRVGSSNREE